MLSLLGFIPVIGPIIDGIVTVAKNRTDASVKKVEIEAGVTKVALESSNDLTKAFKDDVAVRVCRDIIMFPGSIYCGTIIWDRFMDIRYPDLVWGVKPLQGAMEFLPYALLTFFFGAAYLYWNRSK